MPAPAKTRAVRHFVQLTQADVWRLCRHLGSGADPDDLTQETSPRALRTLPRFRGDASARTWLLSIARRVCADHVRRAVRERAASVRLLPSAPDSDPAETVALRDLVARLDPDRRTAFVLTQVLGLSYAEAAEVAGCPIGTIRSRVARARGDLLDALPAPARREDIGSVETPTTSLATDVSAHR